MSEGIDKFVWPELRANTYNLNIETATLILTEQRILTINTKRSRGHVR